MNADVPGYPSSTYRLQMRSGFGFRDALAAVPYLHALGISDLYLSPIATARQGSEHGYDVGDPNTPDPALGTTDEFEALVQAVQQHEMGLLLDVVPNHLAADERTNVWWRDVLQRGAASPFAHFFDIDWNPTRTAMAGKVLLPVLGAPYGETLASGQLQVVTDEDGWRLAYGDRRFPLINPHGEDLSAINGIAGHPASFDRLHGLLEAQHYRLADWRTASQEINYRRFFNIEHLVGLRVDEQDVFEASHMWLRRLLRRRAITGVRVDHPDGLADPAEYLRRLCRLGSDELDELNQEVIPARPYVVVEKILVPGERLPESWPVAGTTGYEFLNVLNGLFIARHHMPMLARIYTRFAGRRPSFAETGYIAKRQVMESTFTADLDRLLVLLHAIAEGDRVTRDFTRHGLRRGLVEITAALAVYRTYVTCQGCSSEDRAWLLQACQSADQRNPDLETALLMFIRDTIVEAQADPARLEFAVRWQQFTGPVFAKAVEDTAFVRDSMLVSLNEVGGDPAHPGTGVREFHTLNQERRERTPFGLLATTTHDTKVSEDVRARLDVLSELPDAWAQGLAEWRRLNQRHRVLTPQGAAPDRHDEYRFYQLLVGLWPADGSSAPASVVERLTAVMIKSAREAKRHTNWIRPDATYEDALTAFVRDAIGRDLASPFIRSLSAFARCVAKAGMVNSLAQTVLKIGSPGVPDFYQGTELWSLRLTDPDNRAVVDLEYRQRLLQDLNGAMATAGEADRPGLVSDLLNRWEDGVVKMFAITEALRLRRSCPALFTTAEYLPLTAQLDPIVPSGPQVVAFVRRMSRHVALVAVPRFTAAIVDQGRWPIGTDVWGEAMLSLPAGCESLTFSNVFTGERLGAADGGLRVAALLRRFPVALAVAGLE
ncbi:MAG: malto-oligosyltrehalose synthase [Acidobacteriota bacterium]